MPIKNKINLIEFVFKIWSKANIEAIEEKIGKLNKISKGLMDKKTKKVIIKFWFVLYTPS